MWQIEWMLSLIPDSILIWLCVGITLLGILFYFSGWLIKLIPGLGLYRLPLRILGIVLTLAGVFFLGGYGVEMSHRDALAKMQEKIDAANAQAAATSRAISEDVKKETVVVKEKGETIIKYVDKWRDRETIKTVEGPERVRVEEVIKYIENCPVPKELVDVHNQAAQMNKKSEGEKK
jgi:hypothetical protein